MAQPGEEIVNGANDERGTVAVLHVGGMHLGSDQQAGCVSEDVASRAGESHPHALLDPYVSLSAHTAPDVRPPTYSKRQ
jgi:hypothetical protein